MRPLSSVTRARNWKVPASGEGYPRFAGDCERAMRDGRLSVAEGQALKRFYESELAGYTYLEPDGAQ